MNVRHEFGKIFRDLRQMKVDTTFVRMYNSNPDFSRYVQNNNRESNKIGFQEGTRP